jgi:putative ABC transport system permease protein
MDGREFRQTDDDKARKVAIVNQAFVDHYFPKTNPIGREVWLQGRQSAPRLALDRKKFVN